MKKKPIPFLSPKLYDEKDILSMEVIRENILDLLLKEAHDFFPQTVPQSIYLHGDFGSGKTFLLLQLKYRLESSMSVWYYDFIFDSGKVRELCDKIDSESIKPHILLLVDNFDKFIENADKQTLFRFRSLLSGQDAPLLIAAGNKVPDTLLNYEDPFYDFFKLVYLSPIATEQCIKSVLDHSVCSSALTRELYRIFEVFDRTPFMINLVRYQVLLGRNQYDDICTGILDMLAPYYESIMSNLSRISRVIFYSLLLHGPSSIFDIREQTRYTSGTVSSYLHLLMEKGLVKRTSSSAKKGIYFVQDSKMKMWAERTLLAPIL